MTTNIEPDALSERFDYICYAIVRELHLQSYGNEQPLDIQSVTVVLNGVASLVRSAMTLGRDNDAHLFFTQMFKSISRQEHRRQNSQDDSEVKRTLRLAVVFIAGWCVLKLRGDEDITQTPQKRAALAVFRDCIEHTHGLEDLIELWEEERATDFIPNRTRSGLSARIGVENWDQTYVRNIRPGFSEAHSLDTSWTLDGLLALLIVQRPTPRLPKSTAIDFKASIKEWPQQHWNIADVQRRLDALLKLDWLKGLADKPDDRKKLIEGIINDRARSAMLERLEIVATTPIATENVENLHKDIRERIKVTEVKGNIEVLRILGIGPSDATAAPIPFVIRWALDREDFVPITPKASGLPEIIADDLVNRTTIQFFGIAEDRAVVETAPLADFASLPQRIESIATELRLAGFSPNVIVIPTEDEFRQALFGPRYWEAPFNRSIGNSHVGRFNGMEVLLWPYSNPQSILVADTHRMFTDFGRPSVDQRLTIWPPNEETESNEALLKAARVAKTIEEVPETRTIKVSMQIALIPNITIGDPSAGRRINVPPALRSDERAE